VSSSNDANISDLGSISPNLGKLSADDANGFLGLGHLTNRSSKDCDSINEEKPMFKSEIERTTIDEVIQIGTSQVKLGKDFGRSIVIDDQVHTVMKDAAPDHGEEKTDKVVDFKYLQPRWCPPGLTCTQKRKLQRLRLVEMQGKE
jgi:ribosomal protein S2